MIYEVDYYLSSGSTSFPWLTTGPIYIPPNVVVSQALSTFLLFNIRNTYFALDDDLTPLAYHW